MLDSVGGDHKVHKTVTIVPDAYFRGSATPQRHDWIASRSATAMSRVKELHDSLTGSLTYRLCCPHTDLYSRIDLQTLTTSGNMLCSVQLQSVRTSHCASCKPCPLLQRAHKPFTAVQPVRRLGHVAASRSAVVAASSSTRKVEIVLKAEDGGVPLKAVWEVEEGTELHSMPFSKPLGAVLAEQKGRVVVERMQDGSNAALGGLQIGDRIRGTTARSKEDVRDTASGSGAEAKQDYWGALVLLNADGQNFDTVMAAINSSRCASCDVTLVVERQINGPNKASPQSPQGKGVKPGQNVAEAAAES